ncbi:MAG: ABC transporter permease [Clostridia bacterium]|nr:ABC transporter permease [Clostridia bacterium]
MDTGKRIARRPVTTAVWLVVIMLASLLIGVAASLYFSAESVPEMLDQRMTTIAVHQTTNLNEDGSVSRVTNRNSLLFEEDIEYLKSLPQVKEIDMRGLSGAYCEDLTAKIGLNNWHGIFEDISRIIGKDVNGSYRNVVLIGTVEQAFTYDYCSTIRYNLSMVGGMKNVGVRNHCAILRVEEVVSMHPDYPLFPIDGDDKFYDGRIAVIFQMFGDLPKSFFQVGKRYAVQGAYDPALSAWGDYPADKYPLLAHVELNSGFISFAAFDEADELACYRSIAYEEGDWFNATEENPSITMILSHDDRVPIAVEWNGTAEELREDAAWGPIIKEYEMALHSFPVLGTNNLESMYSFLTNEAAITEGRTFTQEEYETGARVVVLDEGIAKTAGLSVGDTIRVNQFLAAIGGEEGNNSIGTGWSASDTLINSPTLGSYVFYHGFPEGEPETFTIVGLYRMENEWKNSICSFTPNTIFMPKKAQIEGAYGGPSVKTGSEMVTGYPADGGAPFQFEQLTYSIGATRGVYMSIILENGQMESFLNQLKADTYYEYNNKIFTEEEFTRYLEEQQDEYADYKMKTFRRGLGEYRFLCFDQGFEAAKESIDAVTASAGKLVLLIASGAVLLFVMYLLLYQGTERKTLGIMRSLGARAGQARRYLFASGLLIAAVGIVIGTVLSIFAAGLVSDRLSALSVSQAGSGFDAAYADLFRDMMREGSAPTSSLILLALFEIGLAALALYLQAYLIAKKNPRKLMGK